MKTARMGRCFAVVAVLFLGSSLATAAQVFFDPADVTSNQVYDWAVGTTWADVDGVDVIPGVGDDVFIDGNGTYRTNLKMSDDREINSLTFNSNMKFGLGYTDNYGNTAELPVKTLTITSGNISTTAGTVLAQYSNIRSTIAIPAGTNATWDFGDSSISGNSYTLGLYNVIADSSVTITKNGTKGFTLAGADNAANLAATWHIGGGESGSERNRRTGNRSGAFRWSHRRGFRWEPDHAHQQLRHQRPEFVVHRPHLYRWDAGRNLSQGRHT